MRMRRRLGWSAAGLVLLFAGCGDGDDGELRIAMTSPTAPRPTATASPVGPTPSGVPAGPGTATAIPTATATATPTAVLARFLGTYDGASEIDGRIGGDEWIATVTGTNSALTLALLFDGHSSVGVSGRLVGDRLDASEGGGVLEDDIRVFATGSATFAETSSQQRIRGEVHEPNGGFGFRERFVLTRPRDGRPSRFAGPWTFTLTPSPSGCACVSTVALTIETGDDGMGASVADAPELDEHGAQLGTLHDGDCFVTASGRLRCELVYETTYDPPPGTLRAGPRFLVTLTGTLGAMSGRGLSSAPIFPIVYFLGGTWSAVR